MLTGEVETTDIVEVGVLDQLPDVVALQVLEVVVVGGAEIGAEGAVVAGDDGAAAAGGDAGVDAVLDAQAGGLDGVVQDCGVLVVAGTTEVDDAIGGQDVLGTAGRVLGGAAGNELGVVVGQQVLVQRLVLLLGQDGIVGLEAILLEQSLITLGLDVYTDVLSLAIDTCKHPSVPLPHCCRCPSIIHLIPICYVGPMAEPQDGNLPSRGFSRQRRENSLLADIVARDLKCCCLGWV